MRLWPPASGRASSPSSSINVSASSSDSGARYSNGGGFTSRDRRSARNRLQWPILTGSGTPLHIRFVVTSARSVKNVNEMAPSRSGLHRLIRPWEYRRLRVAAGVRLGGGGFSVGLAAVLFSLGRKAETWEERRKCLRWAAWFLVSGALQLFGGVLDLTALPPAPPSA